MTSSGGRDGQAALIWCPFATKEDALAVAEQLLGEKLIACANILPQVTSVFSWQGEVQNENEVAAVLKTREKLLERACARLAELHPYDVPAIAGWRASETPPVTRRWLNDLT